MAETFQAVFSEAVEIAGGSDSKLAVAAGCSQNAIWAAKRAGRVSPEMAVKIEKATMGKVARWRLRPDLWSPPEEDEASSEASAA